MSEALPAPRAAALFHATVDFEKDGRQIGAIHIPLSSHDDAWGVVPVPVGVIKNGTGPTVILEGGNHGDEYEGPIALSELLRDLDPALVSGRLIIVPAINLPAVAAGHRVSPVDGLNLNRVFPGDPLGTTTRQIAAYLNDVIFPMGDAFIDLHSGGSSLDIIPSAIIEPGQTPEKHAANVRAVTAFGTSIAVVIDNRGGPDTGCGPSPDGPVAGCELQCKPTFRDGHALMERLARATTSGFAALTASR